jgi:hypothetical protein
MCGKRLVPLNKHSSLSEELEPQLPINALFKKCMLCDMLVFCDEKWDEVTQCNPWGSEMYWNSFMTKQKGLTSSTLLWSMIEEPIEQRKVKLDEVNMGVHYICL